MSDSFQSSVTDYTMDALHQHIRVTFEYPVHFTAGVFNTSNPVLREVLTKAPDPRPSNIVAIVDAGVLQTHPGLVERIEAYCTHHADALALAGPVLEVPGGEQVKNDPSHLADIHRAIQAAGLCRHSYVVAVGGGAVLDVVGYAAATAHRGVRLIRVATTVLSQDDSAVGVKNGINAYGKKNYFGTFAAPYAVINDIEFLTTLSDRDWRAGLAEAVKAALIRDAGFFNDLERDAEKLVGRAVPAMERAVRRSAALHLAHIASGDPFELGTSRPLDFGHWAAHKLEQLTNHRLRHGEAVSIGIALDCTYAKLLGELPEPDWTRILTVLADLKLPLYAPELVEHLTTPDHARCVLGGLAEFREHLGGQLTIMLLRSIGNPFEVHEIDTDVMIRSVEVLKEVAEARRVAASGREVHP
jgi:3-dehydroquinate synthase